MAQNSLKVRVADDPASMNSFAPGPGRNRLLTPDVSHIAFVGAADPVCEGDRVQEEGRSGPQSRARRIGGLLSGDRPLIDAAVRRCS